MFNFEDLDFGYSEEGLAGRVELLRDFVDVEFYFEDENNEQFYEVWLNSLFPGLYTEHVFCLGGKDPVLAEAAKAPSNGKPRIFILDKDFDDLLNKKETTEGIIRLNAYSIENYFIDSQALIKVALCQFSGLRPHLLSADQEKIERTFGEIIDRYHTMAKLFYAVRKFGLKSIGTTKKRMRELIVGDGVEDILPDSVVQNYMLEIRTQASKQNNRLQEEEVLLKEINGEFLPKKGCEPLGDPRLFPNMPGKHLLRMLCALYDRISGTRFQDMAMQMVLISIVQTDPNRSLLFQSVKTRIVDSVGRQYSNSA